MKRASDNNPSSIFYWKDYENDEGLRITSLAAQGLWMRLMCVAAKGDPYGYVLINGADPGVTGIARLGSITESEAQHLLDELERNGVFSRDSKGRIFSRRMKRDSAKRKKSVENGKKGGNPKLLTRPGKQKENGDQVNPGLKSEVPPLSHTPIPYPPSSNEEGGGGGGARAENPADQRPEETTLRERVLIAIGYDPNGGFSGPSAKVIGGRADTAEMERWLALPGITADAIVDEVSQVMRTRGTGDGLPSNFRYFTKAMQRLSAALTAPPLEPAAGRPGQGHQAQPDPYRVTINPDDYDDKGNRIRPR